MEAGKDLVRQEYKRYKRKEPKPDFSNVVDFNNAAKFQDKIERSCQGPAGQDVLDAWKVGLTNPLKWEIFKLKACEGFMFIKNPFLSEAQKYWTYKALTEYTRKPFPCNLDVHMELDQDKTVWEISKIKNPSNPYNFMEKLRWTHLGYHFDYNFVNYKEEKYYGFPEDLSKLMKVIATVLGFEKYSPETAIINYYPIGSSMGGHTDHYEEELNAPLISVSFGLPAVFLIGGKTKDVKPEAIWIRSGDIVIMSGESRTAYHAVPCIVKDESEQQPPQCLRFTRGFSSECMENKEQDKDIDKTKEISSLAEVSEIKQGQYSENLLTNLEHISEPDCKLFDDYLSRTRVNINVRQVHKNVSLN